MRRVRRLLVDDRRTCTERRRTHCTGLQGAAVAAAPRSQAPYWFNVLQAQQSHLISCTKHRVSSSSARRRTVYYFFIFFFLPVVRLYHYNTHTYTIINLTRSPFPSCSLRPGRYFLYFILYSRYYYSSVLDPR